MSAPPRIAEWLLASLLPAEEREFVLGDLAEQYATDVKSGRTTAVFRYWKEALAAAWQVRHPVQRHATPLPESLISRPSRGDHLMSSLLHEFRAAAKALRRAPGFAAAAILISAVGLGAATAIFSVVDPILLRPLPYAEPQNLMMVWERDADGASSRIGYASFVDLSTESRTLASSAVMGYWQPTITSGTGDPERLIGQRVSWRFFDVLGVRPAIGRSFVAAEDAPGQPRVVVLTHGLWQRRFGADASIVGRTVLMDGVAMGVAGVLPAGFDDVFEPGTQIYRILGYDVSQPWACRTCRHLRMVGRIRHDVTREAASTELNALSQRMVEAHPKEYPASGINLVQVQTAMTREVRPALLSVLVAALFLLLIAAANVTGLGLARAARRGEEFAVRRALGSGYMHLARQLLAESLLLAFGGGVAGVLIAWGTVRALISHLPASIPRLAAVRLDGAALGVAAVTTLGIGVLVGLAPLANAGRHTFDTMRGAARIAGRRRHRAQAAIVVGEVALALMLMVGTGLLAHSLLSLLSVDPGFEPQHLLTLEVESTGARYPDDAAIWNYHDRVRKAVAAVPGVVAADVTSQIPLGDNFDGNGVTAQDKPLDNPELGPSGQLYVVSPGFLRTMRIPLLRGRDFESAEARDSTPSVAILSASLANRIWGDESALGKRIQVGGPDTPWRTVVGVSGDVRHTGLDATNLQGFYLPERQWRSGYTQVVLVVRTATDPAALAPAVVRAVRSIDPGQPIMHVRTGNDVIATSTARRRLALGLFAAFGIIATLLSAAGVYGALAGAVAERQREIGIRSAIGATPRAIVALILHRGLLLAGAGLALGLVGALALTRYLRALLFGIDPADPLTLAVTAMLLVAVALAACLVPAWRAMRVDPVTALRAE